MPKYICYFIIWKNEFGVTKEHIVGADNFSNQLNGLKKRGCRIIKMFGMTKLASEFELKS